MLRQAMEPSSTIERDQATRSLVVSIAYRPWAVMGMRVGPSEAIQLRITLDDGGRCRHERVDGRPLGDLLERCRDQILEAESRLAKAYRESRSTTSRIIKPQAETPPPQQLVRGAQAGLQAMRDRSREPPPAAAAPAEAAPGDLAPTDCTGCTPEPAVGSKPTSAIFRCDRQEITDRITRLRGKPAEAPPKAMPPPEVVPPPPAAATSAPQTGRALREAQLKAIAEMNELRERRWREGRRHPSDQDLAPTDAVADGLTTTTPEKRTSSVFRCDREAITDRITKLRSKPAEVELPPPPPVPSADPPPTPHGS